MYELGTLWLLLTMSCLCTRVGFCLGGRGDVIETWSARSPYIFRAHSHIVTKHGFPIVSEQRLRIFYKLYTQSPGSKTTEGNGTSV